MHPTITTEPIAARHRYKRGAGSPGLRMVRIPSPRSPNATDSNASPLKNKFQSSKLAPGGSIGEAQTCLAFLIARRHFEKRPPNDCPGALIPQLRGRAVLQVCAGLDRRLSTTPATRVRRLRVLAPSF